MPIRPAHRAALFLPCESKPGVGAAYAMRLNCLNSELSRILHGLLRGRQLCIEGVRQNWWRGVVCGISGFLVPVCGFSAGQNVNNFLFTISPQKVVIMRVVKIPAWFCYYYFALVSERRGDTELADALFRLAVIAAYRDGSLAEIMPRQCVPPLSTG